MADKEQKPQKQVPEQKQVPTAESVWVYDPIIVSAIQKEKDQDFLLTVEWVDFLGAVHTDTVERAECYFNFPVVLRALVSKGYRFNTLIAQAPAMIQHQLTGFRPDPEKVKKALEEHQKLQSKEKTTKAKKA